MPRKPIIHFGPPVVAKPPKELRLLAAALCVLVSASAMAFEPIEDSPDGTDPLVIFTADVVTGKIDPGLRLGLGSGPGLDANASVYTHYDCRLDCLNPLNGQYPDCPRGQGFHLIDATASTSVSGERSCHCTWACYGALKWLIGGPMGGGPVALPLGY